MPCPEDCSLIVDIDVPFSFDVVLSSDFFALPSWRARRERLFFRAFALKKTHAFVERIENAFRLPPCTSDDHARSGLITRRSRKGGTTMLNVIIKILFWICKNAVR